MALPWAGCAVDIGADRNSGGDGERHIAAPQEIGKLFLDEVDYDSGDATDWRYVLVGQRGLLNVTCHFDNVNAKTSITVRDAVGNALNTQYHNGEPRQEATIKVKPGADGIGRYYIAVEALEESAKSQYTCEAKFSAVVW